MHRYGLGKVQRDLGQLDNSIESLRECLEIRRQILEPDHWRVGTAESLLGQSLAIAGHYEEAEIRLTKGVDILERANGPGDEKTKEALERLQDFQNRVPLQRPDDGMSEGAVD